MSYNINMLWRFGIIVIFICYKISILQAEDSHAFETTVSPDNNVTNPVNVLPIGKGHHEWDVLIFTQQWPATVCEEWKKKNATHSCTLPKVKDSWSVHGIWPTKFHTIGPAFCNRSWHFDQDKIKPIESTLMQYWVNIETGTPTYSFWAHEWTKHGTCAAVLEPLNSELKYFSKGLDWINHFNIFDVLKESNIVPSNDRLYSIVDIFNAVKRKLGINADIQCWKENNAIAELRICFDKSLKLTNCDGIVGFNKVVIGEQSVLTNCDVNRGILYSDYVGPPKKILVHLYRLVSWLQWLTL